MNSAALSLPPGLVKICGLRQPEHAVAAVESGADLLGFVFAPSKRRVTPAEAVVCVRAAKAVARRPMLTVGVFVDPSLDDLREAVETAELDLVQLHGSAGPGWRTALPCPSIRALPPMPGAAIERVLGSIDADLNEQSRPLAWLIDGYDPMTHGGTGVRADWEMAARIAARLPLVLAGGLTPENVGEAISAVRPLGVDVASGVETEGSKDAAKIHAFVTAAKAAFESVYLEKEPRRP